MSWLYDANKKRILLEKVPVKRLKITGTRLAAIIGVNKWSTPFQMWCEITRKAKPPFEETQYTAAGKKIEPKQIAFVQQVISQDIQSPEEYYGDNYENMRFDFYPHEPLFGGMWDAIIRNKKGKVTDIFEFKSTKRSEDWANGVPVYYLIQALLYAALEDAPRCHVIVSFLEDKDYNNIDNYLVTEKNTQIYTFNTFDNVIDVNGELYSIKDVMYVAKAWYDTHVIGKFSPEFDEKKDKEYLTILRKTEASKDTGVDKLVEQANKLNDTIKQIRRDSKIADLEKELKEIENSIKDILKVDFDDKSETVVIDNYTLKRVVKKVFDQERFIEENTELYENYLIEVEQYTLRKKEREKNEN